MVGGIRTWDGTWAKRTVDWIRSQNKRLERSGPSVCIHRPRCLTPLCASSCLYTAVWCAVVSNLSYLQLWNANGRQTGTCWTESVSAATAKWKSPVSNVKRKRSALIYCDVRREAAQGCPLRSHFANSVAVKWLTISKCWHVSRESPFSKHHIMVRQYRLSLRYAIQYT